MSKGITGFLNLFKEPGLTSHDCVHNLRKIIGQKKIGHMGTLDPSAEGVLPIALGKATRLIEYVPKDKIYKAVFLLGCTTTTDDMAGEVIRKVEPSTEITADMIREKMRRFIGDVMQTPPIVSAVKVDGQRAYKMFLHGEKPALSPRKVRIESIELIEYKHPEITLKITTGPGVYIRSIARDLGMELKTGACVSSLIRLKSGPFEASSAVKLEEVESLNKRNRLHQAVVNPVDVLNNLARIVVNDNGKEKISNGICITTGEVIKEAPPKNGAQSIGEVLLVDSDNSLLAVAAPDVDGKYNMKKVFFTKNQ